MYYFKAKSDVKLDDRLSEVRQRLGEGYNRLATT